MQSQLDELALLLKRVDGDISRLSLYGIPFAVKDNIDVAGWPTTAGCPEFAYIAQSDATTVKRLREAGAIVVGKTNLDQFATGLVGTRSPYGAVPNSFHPEYISGGSSSGSASVVARGIVPFALGTDTAGSGRVPAGMNNIVGLKPTRGWLPTTGVVPACRTLDCVSVLALTVQDAEYIADIAAGFDNRDAYSRVRSKSAPIGFPARPRFGVPQSPEFFGDTEAADAYARALAIAQEMGAEIVPLDFALFSELASLLYEGPWVAERFSAVQSLWERNPDAIHPVVRSIVERATGFSAMDTFNAEYRRAELSMLVDAVMANVDALFVPTSPTIFTIDQVLADPLVLNSRLGIHTNFANFADMCALAVPAGMRSDGLPAGITLLARAWHDKALAKFGRRWQSYVSTREGYDKLGATGRSYSASKENVPPPASNTIRVAVVGAHLSGMPLNHQLTSRGAAFVEATSTTNEYRLYALANSTPRKPGLVRVAPKEQGSSIAVELWDVPVGNFGSFTAEVPSPLGIGNLSLIDGRTVKGFICEPFGLTGAEDITSFGGWAAYLASL
ncbi:allophanate hydrolase [Granulicella arctica]|uniref:Allophanate hydrolase n=1 Tax=Granulicella arctica TaxID=940613 RepID=A0A7Y9PIZ6_9BACT|nr:allophanate hydrolase [Granulicella arctica]